MATMRIFVSHAEALPLFEHATQLAPQSFSAWFNLGYTLVDLKRFEMIRRGARRL